jgi:hypothetical protein
MAVTTDDLLAPVGPVELVYFTETEDQLLIRLEEYIAQAEAKVAAHPYAPADTDEAVRAYALYLTFDAAYMLKSNRPASASMQDLGSTGFNKEQILAFKEKADFYLAQFHAMVPDVLQDGGAVTPDPGLRTIPTQYTW